MEITPQILEKYSNGQCSDTEKLAVQHWLNTSNENDAILEGVPFSLFLENKLRNTVQKKISAFKVTQPKKGVSRRIVWSMAASIALFIGLGSYLFLNSTNEYKTQIGQIQTITLNDGSIVTLNAASKLIVPRFFYGNTRTVQLEGEAYFEVAKDRLHPFIIKTWTTTTEVLGTKFNLSAYTNDATTLTLNEGKVLFYKKGAHKNDGVIVAPNQRVVLKNNILEIKEVNSSLSKAWAQKQLVYTTTTVKEVMHDIERFYGVTIKVEKQGLENRLYRGKHNNPSLQDLMQKMSFVLKFKYRSEGRIITIY
ncbi:putative anti-sigma factor [Polaribacter irgensii 23-P]|uniref:Putative anti-sigma factor n=1 Tax=Polaribacter irgensii 23-P TaxID=313594 RepID=A4C0J5_9FLAO|nr:FecR family protein [Polaribacter irgensii]EAR12938.1 putative anti-sigma factor [Polaribacter irgensii 23-P]